MLTIPGRAELFRATRPVAADPPGGLVEIDVPRPAAGAARHVTAQSVVFALQEIRERGL